MRFPWWALNAALLAVIALQAWGGLYALLAILVVLVLPGKCIAWRFGLTAPWRAALALPLGMLWLFLPVMAVSALQLPVLSRAVLWLLILLPPLLSLPRFVRSSPLKRMREGFAWFATPSAAAIISLVAICFLIMGPAVLGTDTPSTDASGYLERAYFVHTSLEKYSYVSLWYAGAQLGYPIYTFDPPLFYIGYGAVLHLFGPHPVILFDVFIGLFFSMFILGVFALARKAFANDLAAFAAAALVALNPHLGGLLLFQGNIKLYAGFSLLPLVIVLMLQKDRSAVLLGVLFATLFAAHPTAATIAGIVFVVASALRLSRSNARDVLREAITIGVVASVLLAGFLIPLLVFKSQGFSYAPDQFEIPGAGEFISSLFSEPAPRVFDAHLGFVWMFVALILAGIGVYHRDKLQGSQVVLVLGATFVAATLLGAFTPVGQLIVTFDRMLPLLLVIIACCAGMGVASLSHKSNAAAAVAVALALCIVSWTYLPVWNDRVDQWVQTNFITDYLAEGDGSVFSTFSKDRITSYGFFAPSIMPPLTIAYGIPTNSYGFSQGQHANTWFTKLVNTSTWGPFRSTTGTYLYNVFLSTGTKYIWARRCYDGGQMLLDRFVYACDNCTLKSYLVDATNPDTACEVVLALPNASLVETTTPAVDSGEDLFGERGAYKVVAVPLAAGIEGLPVISPSLINMSPEPLPLEYSRTDERIVIKGAARDAWVVVKEERFPRWTAQVDGAPARIFPTSLEFMLVRVPAGATLELTHTPLWWERAAAFFSLLALVILLVVPEQHIYKRSGALPKHG